MHVRPRVAGVVLAAFTLASFIVGTPTWAQDSGERSKLQVHGFLTQAYAKAKFLKRGLLSPSENELLLGISEDGTTAYRNLAIQFRYEMTPQDIVVVQLSNRSLGDSLITDLEDEVELDWGFYERRIGADTSVKIGRVQIPLGIFNEIRDVGTTLPFYRPSFAFYQEGAFTSETLDGIVVSHNFAAESDWSLETDWYFGEWDLVESLTVPGQQTVALARTKDSYGTQFWLNTPVTGLRFGLGGHKRKTQGGLFRPPGVIDDGVEEWYLSVEGAFDRWTVRAEHRQFDVTIGLPFAVLSAELSSSYGQLGFKVVGPLHAWLQYEVQGDSTTSAGLTTGYDIDYRTDLGFALNYFFTPNVVLKAEYHEVEEEQVGFAPVFIPPATLKFAPIIANADDGNYWIVSLSASF